MFIRRFTKGTSDPYSDQEWEHRDVIIIKSDGSTAFEQKGVHVPKSWSLNATSILAQKYFRGALGAEGREASLVQIIARVVQSIVKQGLEEGYFSDEEEAQIFTDELSYILSHQMASFNSPVWFNIGVEGVSQQASACFILSIDDDMNSILNWYAEEGIIFKGGSGAGLNLSKIRSSKELLKGGGTASGPVSFMRGADASAGTIKSGGKTRRAAAMRILNIDHPDIGEFIWCKAVEERKARALRDAGFDMDLDGKDSFSIQYQNANNSVRVTDEFMRAVRDDADFELRAVTDGSVLKTVKARSLFRQIAEAAWQCGDPGLQFDTTINRWHTTPNAGRINGSNPCSEYVSLDNSACNLASLNLLAFLGEDGVFDTESFVHAASLVFTAQDILVGYSDYPTESIAKTARAYRQLGLGYANLGALLMTLGLPYDSDGGRALAATLTALMTGVAYKTSAELASRLGPFAGYSADSESVFRVLEMHKDALKKIDRDLVPFDLFLDACDAWGGALHLASSHGVRNAQVSLLAPTGTISFLMDCDTTGIEPAFSLVTFKKLVGGGKMVIPIRCVSRALESLGYDAESQSEIAAEIAAGTDLSSSASLKPEHLAVFATAMGSNAIAPSGHLEMMAAVQPFLSGAISKTVNLPEDATVEEVEDTYAKAWEIGLKAVALYRDNSKAAQPLSTQADKVAETVDRGHERRDTQIASAPVRRRLPRHRRSRTYAFRVGEAEGYVTVGEYDDGRPGELFAKVSKQGSTLAGIMDAFSIGISLGLQHGVPLETYVSKFTNMRFEPAGMTDDPDLRIATSLVDYIFRRIAVDYLDDGIRSELGIHTSQERMESLDLQVELEEERETFAPSGTPEAALRTKTAFDAPLCYQCGTPMKKTGSCHCCPSCGQSSGCS
ncbi:MAG: vitamin B12-dependent ribonucleotide reductase [Actinomycetota bacterium]|nr:vitamin B12-dependent ribonucleotide reductase [Actinomycetota bacterium]